MTGTRRLEASRRCPGRAGAEAPSVLREPCIWETELSLASCLLAGGPCSNSFCLLFEAEATVLASPRVPP